MKYVSIQSDRWSVVAKALHDLGYMPDMQSNFANDYRNEETGERAVILRTDTHYYVKWLP